MNIRLNEIKARLAYMPRTVRLIWRAAQSWTVAWLALLCVEGALPAAFIYFSRSLIDSLTVAIGTGWSWDNIRPVALPATLMVGAVALKELAHTVIGWVRTAQSELVRDHLYTLIHEKSIEVDLAFYESPQYHDQLERTRNDLSNRPLALLESIGGLLQNMIALLAMAALLVPYGVWLPFLLVIGTIPAFYVVLHFNQRYHAWWENTTADRRRAQYYDMLLTHSSPAAELRLFGLGPHFKSAYQSLRRRMRRQRLRMTRDQSMARLGAGTLGALISGLTLAWMFWRALQGRATLGDLALFYQAFQHGQGLLRSLLENVGQIYANTLFLGNLFEFLDLRPRVRDSIRAEGFQRVLRDGIHFQQVSFCYPGSERRVFQGLDLPIPAGQIVAIVGANGAGKSTLLKLLCRFYDPEAGRITLDGIDIRDVPLKELRGMMTVLFQWPVPYQATAAENIAFSEISSGGGANLLESAARGAGVHDIISRLPQGYDTLLGKWFAGGVELSVGEWQRLALARAFYRRAQILILDEPTSSLDPWAEADWFDRFRLLADGRTALIITHRFTIAKRADIIHVMDAGQILESGTHTELLDRGGLYAQSWFTHVQAAPGIPQCNSDICANESGATNNNGVTRS